MPSVRLPEYELSDLFTALGVWRCLDERSVAVRAEPSHPARLCALPGAASYCARVIDGEREWARVHYIECPSAGVIGRWPFALRIGDLTMYRLGHQQRPA